MTFYAASYGPRYSDPIATFVCLFPGKAGNAADNAAAFERTELPSYCEDEDCKGDCAFCDPDVETWGEGSYRAKDLFSAAELREHRQELRRGEVICLTR